MSRKIDYKTRADVRLGTRELTVFAAFLLNDGRLQLLFMLYREEPQCKSRIALK